MDTQTERTGTCDAAIIGAGMAGLTAAIYALRFKLAVTVYAKEPGGVINESALVENWPGEKAISGKALMERVRAQAEALGARFVFDEVTSVKRLSQNPILASAGCEASGSASFLLGNALRCIASLSLLARRLLARPRAHRAGFEIVSKSKPGAFEIKTAGGTAATARAVLLAIGCERRKLGVPGEKEFTGRGVSYCTTCDAFFFRGKKVAVVGGSDSAVGSAELLAGFADKVYIIYRRDKLRSEPMRTDRALANPKIEPIYNSTVEAIEGRETVTGVTLNGARKLALDGVFVEIGFDPPRRLPSQLGVALDDEGFIRIDAACRTNVPGVYAAGDVTTGSNKMRQLVTAAAEGAIAAESMYEDLRNQTLEL